MSIVLPTMPITELRSRQPEILAELQKSPVVLTHHGHGAAVLISPSQWNAQQMELQRLRALVEALAIKAKNEPTVSLAEVKRRIATKKTPHHGMGD